MFYLYVYQYFLCSLSYIVIPLHFFQVGFRVDDCSCTPRYYVACGLWYTVMININKYLRMVMDTLAS